MQEHFFKGAVYFMTLANDRRTAILENLSRKGKPKRGAHIVEVKEAWLGKTVANENELPVTWCEDYVDGIKAIFVERDKIRKALPGVRAEHLQPLLQNVDTYNPKKELVFFIFVCGPTLKKVIIQTI